MKKITISLNNEYRELFIDGSITRHMSDNRIIKGSENWKITGFSIINNFGCIVESLSIEKFFEIFENNKDYLFYKNEKPKFIIHDIDHGTHRTWRNLNKLRYHYNLIKGGKNED